MSVTSALTAVSSEVYNDAQVAAARAFVPRKSLLDVLLEHDADVDRDPAYPFRMRVLLCGAHSAASTLNARLEQVARDAAEAAAEANPLPPRDRNVLQVNSLVIDYGERFVQLLEGADEVVRYYVKLLSQGGSSSSSGGGGGSGNASSNGALCSSAVVLFLDDDVPAQVTCEWVYVDKVPPLALDGAASEQLSEDALMDAVVADLQKMVEMARLASAHASARAGSSSGAALASGGATFAEEAKMNYARLYPKTSSLDTFVKSGSFLTLRDFVTLFCQYPSFVRDGDLVHPADDPLDLY